MDAVRYPTAKGAKARLATVGAAPRPRWRNRMITHGSSADHIDPTEPAEEHSHRLRMNGPGSSPRVAQPREVSSGSIAKEAGMTTRDQLGDSWTVVLRRQPARAASMARWRMLADRR